MGKKTPIYSCVRKWWLLITVLFNQSDQGRETSVSFISKTICLQGFHLWALQVLFQHLHTEQPSSELQIKPQKNFSSVNWTTAMSSGSAFGPSSGQRAPRTINENTYKLETSPTIREERRFSLETSSLNVNYETDCGDESISSYPLQDDAVFAGSGRRRQPLKTHFTYNQSRMSSHLRSEITTEVGDTFVVLQICEESV